VEVAVWALDARRRAMLKPYLILFGLVTLGGGIQGYLAGSNASIIAGGAFAALLIIGAFLLSTKPTLGKALAGIASLAIAGRFIPVFVKTSAVWPAGVLSVLSVIALVLLALSFRNKAATP
jgi:uncharacterized membrane protein (UPF0136 family)